LCFSGAAKRFNFTIGVFPIASMTDSNTANCVSSG
jgi:hypothetical protein